MNAPTRLSPALTVLDVTRDLGVEPDPHTSWAIGAAVRDEYVALYGCLPPKALRTKTSGAGTHCFAVYSAEMRPIIERVVRAHEVAKARQGELFEGGAV